MTSKPHPKAASTRAFFYRLIRFQPFYFSLDLIGISLFYLLAIPTGLLLQAFFNHREGAAHAPSLPLIIGIMALVTLGKVIGLGGANIASIFFTTHAKVMLYKNMLRCLLQQPGAQPLPDATGTIVSTFRDDVEKTVFWTVWIQDQAGLLLTAVIAIIIMLRINIWITLGTLLPLFIILLIAHRLSHRLETYYQASREATGQVTGVIGELFQAAQAIKVAQAEASMMAHFQRVNAHRQQTAVQARMIAQLLAAASDNSVTIGTGLILLLAAQFMQQGSFSVGDFALFVTYIWPVAEFMRISGELYAQYKQAGVSVARMQALIEPAPPTQLTTGNPTSLRRPFPVFVPLPSPPRQPLQTLTVTHLTYHFPTSNGQQRGITHIDLHLERGTLTVITGRVGSGKTTLLRVLLGLLPQDAGQIYWNDTAVTNRATFFIPPQVAYMPQVPTLFSESVRQNILQGLPETAVHLPTALEKAVLTPDLKQMPAGLDTLIGPRGTRLSGGQQQRTAAARMFVRQPELLVFDDLSSALDAETEKQLWTRLLTGPQPPTCLAVSHRQAVLERADQIIVLQNGRVAATGTLAHLRHTCPEMQHLLTQKE